MRIAQILEYDGSHYCGWQSQASGCSIQDQVESAVSVIACKKTRVVTAGRTDSGVHALYQVVHFDVSVQRPENAWIRGVNANLPEDIAVLWASAVPDTFHARFSAINRRYLYFLMCRPMRPGLGHQKVGWYHQPLDLIKMKAAAELLCGRHDFSAFRAAECQAKSPIRTLSKLDIARYGHVFVFEICANAFLHHMVRNIIGCLIYVGNGTKDPQWITDLIGSKDRVYAAPTFSAAGLYLAGVCYDPKWKIPDCTQIPGSTVLPMFSPDFPLG